MPPKLCGSVTTIDYSRFDCVYITYQKHQIHVDLHHLWIGTYGFDFPLSDLVDTKATPVALKPDVNKLVMTKIINHIVTEATHTDPGKVPDITTTLEQLNFTIVHEKLFNGRKKFNTNDDFNSALSKIQDKANKT